MIQQRPPRFGIFGAGIIAGDKDGFLPNLTILGGKVEITAVAGVVPEHAQRITQRFDINTVHESLDEMLRDDHVEVVANLTPISAHAETPMRILRNGRHLLSGRPLVITLEEADALIEEAERQGVVFVCALLDTLYAQYRETRRLIGGGCIGQVCFTWVRSSHGGPGGIPDRWPFNSARFYRPGDGSLFDMGVYGTHEITSLLGPAWQVLAFGGITEAVRIVHGTDPFGGLQIPVATPDNPLLTLDFGDSTFTVIDTTFNVLASKVPKMEVSGRRGAIAIYRHNENPLEVFVQDLEPGVGAWMAPEDLSRANNVREQELHRVTLMEHLINCVRSGRPPIADAYKARHTLEITIIATESVESGRVIELATSL